MALALGEEVTFDFWEDGRKEVGQPIIWLRATSHAIQRRPLRTPQSPAKIPSAAANRAAQTITYTYDEAGRLVQVDYGGGKPITYTYDKAGNLLRREVASGP